MTRDKDVDRMSEAEPAEYYYANRDDLAGDEVALTISPRVRPVSVRFSPEEFDRVEAAAEAAGMKLSAYIRQAATSNVVKADIERARADLANVLVLVLDATEGLGGLGRTRRDELREKLATLLTDTG